MVAILSYRQPAPHPGQPVPVSSFIRDIPFFRLKNYKVLKGIVFDDSLAKEHILELTETEKTPEGKVKFSAKIFSHHKNGKPLFHYSLNVVLLKNMPDAPLHTLPININDLAAGSDKRQYPYHDGTLFHGPAFQGVKRVLDISEGRIILECNLPEIAPDQQGQFPLQTSNPFIYDAIVQSLLIWTQMYYKAPCLPSHLVGLGTIPAYSLSIRPALSTFRLFLIQIHQLSRIFRLLIRMERFMSNSSNYKEQ